MFQMKVTDAMKVHENLISVAGSCSNKSEFAGRLVDNNGDIYEAHIPFDKRLEFDDTRIMLGIFGRYDAKAFIGLTLRNTN